MNVAISYFAAALALAATGHFVQGEDDTAFLIGETLNLTAIEMANLPANCEEAYKTVRGDGVYLINAHGSGLEPFPVYCYKNPNEVLPWMVILRRMDATDFYRSWNEYQYGFGNVKRSFHAGMAKWYALTNFQGPQELRIRLGCGKTAEAKFSRFRIGSEYELYALLELGNYTGNAGDALTAYHLHQPMTTRDAKNDRRPFGNMAQIHRGAWWFGPNDIESDLNGVYPTAGRFGGTIYWNTMGCTQPINNAEMAIRPARYLMGGDDV